MNETHTTNKQTNNAEAISEEKNMRIGHIWKHYCPITIYEYSNAPRARNATNRAIRACYKIKQWPSMPLRLLLTALHHLFVVALKRENLTIVLHTFIKTNGFGQMYINANNLLSTCLSLAIQLGLPLLGAEEGLVLHPSLSSPALLDSQESVGL